MTDRGAGAAATGGLDVIDPSNALPSVAGRWERTAPIPLGRSEVTACAFGDRIYTFGGVHRGATVDAVDVYDPDADAWTTLAPLPIPLDHTMAVSVGDAIYLIAGSLSATNHVSGETVAEMMRTTNWSFAPRSACYRYDPASDSYDRIADAPLARLGHAAVAIGRRIYVMGGQGPNPGMMMVYDVDADRWGFLPGMPSFREHHAVGVLGGRIHAVGGRWPDPLDPDASFMVGQVNTDVHEVYDPGSRQWGTRAPLPTARGAGYGAVLDGKLYVAGGEVLDSPDRLTYAEVEVFDPAVNGWAVAPPLPTARHGLAVVALGGRLYAIAGGPLAAWDQTDVVEVFTPARDAAGEGTHGDT
jgi:N-acetylneuraminic acid mutarotase